MIRMDVRNDDRDKGLRVDAGSFWTGLPPQSISRAPSGTTTTIDVVSRTADGTDPDVPRKAKCISAISG
jgi:hypothetical protein